MKTNRTETLEKMDFPFWFGGLASCMATLITHPLDLIKVRMQISKRLTGLTGTITNIIRYKGFKTMYNGLTASILRQATYSTTRFGIYHELKSTISKRTGKSPRFGTLICIATISGAYKTYIEILSIYFQ